MFEGFCLDLIYLFLSRIVFVISSSHSLLAAVEARCPLLSFRSLGTVTVLNWMTSDFLNPIPKIQREFQCFTETVFVKASENAGQYW